MSDGGDLWVAIIMGSKSDWETMKAGSEILTDFDIPHECKVLSAHRTPERLRDYGTRARASGLKVIVAAAGGAAALPGAIAALTPLPVLGVPMQGWALKGLDALLSMVQMPAGIPVGTLAIGKPGAINAALLAAAIVALGDADVAAALDQWRAKQTAEVPEAPRESG